MIIPAGALQLIVAFLVFKIVVVAVYLVAERIYR